MNYTQTFEEFSKSVSTLDLALYAGAGLVLWALFKDKLSPVQKIISDIVTNVKSKIPATNKLNVTPVVPSSSDTTDKEAVFFDLIVSWKQTRDLAAKSNCIEAVKVADQMFPYLSPNICGSNKENV
jgi:hypothetical protein